MQRFSNSIRFVIAFDLKGNKYTYRGSNSVNFALFLFLENEYTLKGKNFLPLGANSFLLVLVPFYKEFGVQENKQ